MPRAKKGAASTRRRTRILKRAKGYYGGRSRLLRIAKHAVLRAAVYATRDRQQRKRNFRSLWITRVRAAAEQHGISYSRLIAGMRRASIEVNRKILADMAINDPAAFAEIVKAALAAPTKEAAGVEAKG
jgi:large subunit ribosomal protein L20